MLSVPATFTSYDLGVLDRRGLGVARTIRNAPVGLIARAWDSEGDSEWLTTSSVFQYRLLTTRLITTRSELDGGAEITLRAASVGVPVDFESLCVASR